MTFKPKILGFLCNWCSYAGADLAGVSRIQYPPNIRIVRVMCSGRVEPYFIFKALEEGIDGIIIMGCHPGECHYVSGNLEARTKFSLLQKLLSIVHLNNRIRLEWVSASEGVRFADIVTKFTSDITSLGPSPMNSTNIDEQLVQDLHALRTIADGYRLRALIGRQRALTEEGNVYNRKILEEDFETLLDESIYNEFYQQKIYQSLQQKNASVNHLAEQLKLESSKVLEYIVNLKKRGMVDFAKIQGLSPYYTAIQEGS